MFKVKNTKRFWIIVCALLVILPGMGCRTAPEIQSSQGVSVERLLWCISEIESGRIRRGMSTDELQKIFGGTLDFYHEENAYAFLSRPLKMKHGDVPPPLWKIDFSISTNKLCDN
ncbi:MAG TPA: hypothetical protein VGH19_17825 [Verrucomicrobiae bacterium]